MLYHQSLPKNVQHTSTYLMLTIKKDFSVDKKKRLFQSRISEFAQNWCTKSLEHADQEYQLGFRMRLLKRN